MGYDERHVLPSLRLLPYDRLVLVVSPRFFGLLRHQMSKRVSECVGSVFEKDYTARKAHEVKSAIAA